MEERASIKRLRELLRLEKYKGVVNDDGSVVIPSSQIFTNLSNCMDATERLKPKYIYTILKLNRYNIHTEVLEHFGIIYEPPIKNDMSLDDSGCNKISFTVDITNIWKEICTEDVVYKFKNRGPRTVGTLKRGSWTNYLFEEIFKCTKIQCPLTFKRSKTSNSGYAITVNGHCPECDCQFNGYVVNEPSREDDSIQMECHIINYDSSFEHEKKRQLKGSKRVKVAEELVEGQVLPVIWRRKEADKLMDIGDKEPPHLFTGAVLRKAKQERQDHLLGIKSNNIYESLQQLKYSQKIEGGIHSIGLDPIYVHYWSNEQIAIYTQYHEVLYIDATGSLMKKVKLPNGELSSHVYLYQAVTQVNNKTAPVFQMVSSVQNTVAIAFWLMEFLRIGSTHKTTFPFPKEVVTDFDRALIGAVVKVFAKKNTLSDYLSECFKLLRRPAIQTPPNSFIRLDICHFMNMISKWKFWRGLPGRVKQFYVRSMAALRHQTTLEGIEDHAKAMFIMALNSNQAFDNSTSKARNLLTDSIRGVTVDDQYLTSNEHETESNDDSNEHDIELDQREELVNTNIFKWVNDLYKSAQNEIALEDETTDVNGFHCPKVAKKLKTLLPYFPLFSEVMTSIFGYGSERPTSAAVESEFNDLKNRVLRNITTPMRMDKFITRHLSSFPGKLKIAMANQDPNDGNVTKNEVTTDNRSDSRLHLNDETSDFNQESTEINAKNIESPRNESEDEDLYDEFSELGTELNWRNKNSKTQVRKYIDPLPQFDPTLTSTIMLPTIVNGNYCRNIKSDEQIFVVRNTCGFDSICQILATTLKNNVQYKQSITEVHSPIHECALTLIDKGLTAAFYKQRVLLLNQLKLFETERTSVVKINAAVNITNLAEALFSDTPSCIAITKCQICDAKDERIFVVINVNHNVLRSRGFQQLSDAIESGYYRSTEKCCKEIKRTTRIYGPTILVDTDTGDRRLTKLNDIPLEINVLQGTVTKRYVFAGAVAYQGTFKINSIGHYTALIKEHEQWIRFDDDSKKGKSYIMNDNEKIHVHMCIYVIP